MLRVTIGPFVLIFRWQLHYCVFPRFLWPLGKLAAALSLGYNVLFRKLFLFTLTPSDVGSRIMAFFVVYVSFSYR